MLCRCCIRGAGPSTFQSLPAVSAAAIGARFQSATGGAGAVASSSYSGPGRPAPMGATSNLLAAAPPAAPGASSASATPPPQSTQPLAIFVGGVGVGPVKTTEAELTAAFSQYGAIEAVMLKSGYSFVRFFKPESVAAALASCEGLYISGVPVTVEAAISKEEKKAVVRERPTANTVWVGGFGVCSVPKMKLTKALESFGEVVSVVLGRGSYAFVEFCDDEAAQAAVAGSQGISLPGVTPFQVELADEKAIRVHAAGGWLRSNPRCTVWVGWLLADLARKERLKDIFSEFGEVERVAAKGGYSLVTFADLRGMEAALAGTASGAFEIDGVSVRVSPALPKDKARELGQVREQRVVVFGGAQPGPGGGAGQLPPTQKLS